VLQDAAAQLLTAAQIDE